MASSHSEVDLRKMAKKEFAKSLSSLTRSYTKRRLGQNVAPLPPPSFPRAACVELGQKVIQCRERFEKMKWAFNADSKPAFVTTKDLRFSLRKVTGEPTMAAGQIYVNQDAQSREVKVFVKNCAVDKAKQLKIGGKIRFWLGASFNAEAIARAIGNGGIGDGEASEGRGGDVSGDEATQVLKEKGRGGGYRKDSHVTLKPGEGTKGGDL